MITSIDILKAMGAWMKVNGAAIYGTKASPLGPLPWGRCTQKPEGDHTLLYLSVFDWPADGNLLVPGVKGRVVAARLLAGSTPLKTEPVADGLLVHLPAAAPDTMASVVRLTVQGSL